MGNAEILNDLFQGGAEAIQEFFPIGDEAG